MKGLGALGQGDAALGDLARRSVIVLHAEALEADKLPSLDLLSRLAS